MQLKRLKYSILIRLSNAPIKSECVYRKKQPMGLQEQTTAVI